MTCIDRDKRYLYYLTKRRNGVIMGISWLLLRQTCVEQATKPTLKVIQKVLRSVLFSAARFPWALIDLSSGLGRFGLAWSGLDLEWIEFELASSWIGLGRLGLDSLGVDCIGVGLIWSGLNGLDLASPWIG